MTRDLDHVRGRVVDLGPYKSRWFASSPGQRHYIWYFENAKTGELVYCDDTATTLADAMDHCAKSVCELRAYIIGREFARIKGSMLDGILQVTS